VRGFKWKVLTIVPDLRLAGNGCPMSGERTRARGLRSWVQATFSPYTYYAALSDPMIKTRLANLGSTPFVATPADLGKFVADEIE
jgi:hypothetical protein